jgi:hypothetical protein
VIGALGFVSMLVDISLEMIHALPPIYMVGVLGASTLAVGINAGIAEATASIVKVFPGALSGCLVQRKLLSVIGYAVGAITKPVRPLAAGHDALVGARFVDRGGKISAVRRGMRSRPTSYRPKPAGRASASRQSPEAIGAFSGPLVAVRLMWHFADNF